MHHKGGSDMTMSRITRHHAHTGSGRKRTDASLLKDVIGSMTHFDRQAAEKAKMPGVTTMFLSIAEEEQKQFEVIRALRRRAGAGTRPAGTIWSMISALKRREDRLLKKIGAKTDEVEALRIAMDIEMESIRFYVKLLRETEAPAHKEIVGSLLKEENSSSTRHSRTPASSSLILQAGICGTNRASRTAAPPGHNETSGPVPRGIVDYFIS